MQNELEGNIRTIAIDYEAKVIAVAGSLRTTIPLTLARQLSLDKGDTILLRLIEVGDSPVRALLLRKKTSAKRTD